MSRGFFLLSGPEELEELGADDAALLEHVRDTGNLACGSLADPAPVEADPYGHHDVTEQDFAFVPPAHRVAAFTLEEQKLKRAREHRAKLERSRKASERQRRKRRALQREELRTAPPPPPQPAPQPEAWPMQGPLGYGRGLAMHLPLPELTELRTLPTFKTIHDVRAGQAGRVVRATPYRREG
jgi:hypothetical protein